jgi:glycosyltransferase involved in cell wall biosynthesis
MPKLSIIIPCYNCELTLRAAVESCYKQGFSSDEFEIILVDDKSTDSTRKLMNDLSERNSNVRLFYHDKNLGGGSTRNTAVSHSLSEIIFCLDSDDLLPPNTLKKMFDFLLEKKCDGVCFKYSKKFRGNNIEEIIHVDTFAYRDSPVPFTSLLLPGDALSPVELVFMYTKTAFNKISGYPTHHGFDTQGFGWRFLSAGLKAFICNGSTYLHRVEFTKSYYLREYLAGKANHNNQCILMEHLDLFNLEARNIITSFDTSDFTRDIMCEVQALKNPLLPNYIDLLGTLQYTNKSDKMAFKPVSRNSLKGIWLRAKYRLKVLLKLK